MNTHPRAKLGPAARLELCRQIEDGISIRVAAQLFNVSPATAHKWRHRWLEASVAERCSLVCLRDRSSRRAQVLAADNAQGKAALIELLQAKLEAQARVVERMVRYRPTELANRKENLTVAQATAGRAPRSKTTTHRSLCAVQSRSLAATTGRPSRTCR